MNLEEIIKSPPFSQCGDEEHTSIWLLNVYLNKDEEKKTAK